jgi:hypothetical protein
MTASTLGRVPIEDVSTLFVHISGSLKPVDLVQAFGYSLNYQGAGYVTQWRIAAVVSRSSKVL